MKNLQQIFLITIVSTISVLAQNPNSAKPANSLAKTAPQVTNKNQPNIGEQKFNANCSRCHSAPQQLSPSITRTVVRHMRVRANLSAQDEKDILRFLAP